MDRRQFLAGATGAAVLSRTADAQTGTHIRHVDIVHHTHTDVGYTALPSVVRDLQRRYLDAAIDACAAEPAFRWTIESLLGLDDWWRASTPARHASLLDLVKTGRMDSMGLPFNQTPCLNALQWRQMMEWIPQERWRSLAIRAAMQNDVNGFPRAGALALLDRGIRHLLMGINPDSGGPPFARPTAFWWKMPDSRRLFVWLGEHYGSAMAYVSPAWDRDHLRTEEAAVRAAHENFSKRLLDLEAEGYGFDRLLLTYTNPNHYDNGEPVPSLAPFVAAWNRLGLEPVLRLTTATAAVLDMEKAVGGRTPELEGEWTDWWANGDASSPREVAASRVAKRSLAAALAPVFGPLPERAKPQVESILRDLCLFDEHTWGAAASISAPYSLETQAQFAEKSALAWRPMGAAAMLLDRRLRARTDSLGEGAWVTNAAPAEISGWAAAPGGKRWWVEKLAANKVRTYRNEAPAAGSKPEVKLDGSGWPRAAVWSGMAQPLFDGALADFLAAEVVAPANRSTIAQLHTKFDAEKRRAAFRETPAAYGDARVEETPHTLRYSQEVRHERLRNASRTVELWKREPRARVLIRFDRVPSLAPEVLLAGFALPDGLPLPQFSSGGVPFTPYRDQLRGSCRDYFGIDGWAHYRGQAGEWLWVTRDAPLVAVGGPHVVERHQQEPAERHRLYARVFDNCWHTNFVADENGTMEFQFELAWSPKFERPADAAEALASDPIVAVNNAMRLPASLIDNLYRP